MNNMNRAYQMLCPSNVLDTRIHCLTRCLMRCLLRWLVNCLVRCAASRWPRCLQRRVCRAVSISRERHIGGRATGIAVRSRHKVGIVRTAQACTEGKGRIEHLDMCLTVAKDDCSLDRAARWSGKVVRVSTREGAVDGTRHSSLACVKSLKHIEFSASSSVLPARA